MGIARSAVIALFCAGLLGVSSCGDAAFELGPSNKSNLGGSGGSGGDGGSGGIQASGGTGGSAPTSSGAGGSGGKGSGGSLGAPFGDGGAPECWETGTCYQQCPPAAEVCLSCDDATDCPATAPTCDERLRRCVECLGEDGCALGETCDPLSGFCAPSCQTSADCAGELPLCDVAREICVACTEDQHCRAEEDTPFCVLGQCVECFGQNQCPMSRPYCRSFQCLECVNDFDCGLDGNCGADHQCY